MGSYYAQADGEDAEVAQAIREHYLPRGAGDALPATRDRHRASRSPTSSTRSRGSLPSARSPSGTRIRSACAARRIGVLRILIEKGLELDLRRLIDLAVAAVRADIDRLRADGAAAAPKAHVGADVVAA